MRLKLGLALSALVPVLGLFSCSKDSPTNDGWRLSEPQIVSGEQLLALEITEAPLQRLAGDSLLRFNADEMTDSKLTVKAQCQSKIGTTLNEQTFVGRSEFTLRSLWPRELWLALADEELQQSSCNFTFAVSHGKVVHDFSMKTVRLTNFSDHAHQNILSAALKAVNAGVERNIHFLCETYSASEPLPNGAVLAKDFENTLQRLAEKKWTSNQTDPRVLKAVQQCRLLVENLNTAAPFALSNTFIHKFSPPALVIVSSNDFANANRDTWHSLNVFTLQIRNTSSYVTAFAVPSNLGNIRLRLVGRQNFVSPDLNIPLGTFILGSRILSEPVNYQPSKSPYFKNEHLSVFELHPDEEIVLEGRINSGANCYQDVTADPAGFPSSRNMGLMYGYEQELQISQFRQWAADSKDVNGERFAISSAELFPRTTDVPTVFAPSASFQAMVGQADRLPGYLVQYPSELLLNQPFVSHGLPVHNYCFFNKLRSANHPAKPFKIIFDIE
ncbi:MAG: hypothetical protein EOP06_16055 [Proteobacteria bacterium]|nr:MAG: hypothetical protein EOP06_16055 [Pseudomonadota bacterium]